MNTVNIVADQSIPFAEAAFRQFGTVTVMPGARIDRAALAQAQVLLVRSVTPVNAGLLDGTPVRFVGTATIGFDHVDRDYLAANAIGFAYAPGSNADSVMQYVYAALVHLFHAQKRAFDGLTIGVVGCGSIGSRIAAAAEHLGMRCLICDPPLQRATGNTLFVPLERLLADSDIVTLHVPLTRAGADATYHLAGDTFFRAMKQGAVFVNTSRGAVVDETALKENRGRLGGVILDVWEHEPAIDPEIAGLADIATPHIAGYSWEGKLRGTRMIYEALCGYLFAECDPRVPPQEAEPAREISVALKKHPLYHAVGAAYAVMDDDAALRKALAGTPSQRGEAFDRLRREYPKRPEFGRFVLRGTGTLARQFTALGFTVAD